MPSLQLHLDPTAIERHDRPTPWSSSSSPAALALVDRLLQRIPSKHEEVIRRHLLNGEPQPVIAADLGVSQPTVSVRIKCGLERLRWVARTLPDLTPDEVREVLQRVGEREPVVDVAAAYWREHTIAQARGSIASRTAHAMLFEPRPKYGLGLVERHRGARGPLGEVVRGLVTIRMARWGGGPGWGRSAPR